MATIYTRATKGSALTWTEGDANITNLNNAKLENVVEDTTPQLGGNLDVNGNSIVSVSNANIEIAPNGTGDVYLTADLVRVGDSNANATITTNGTGDLILSTNSGSNSGVITIQDGLDNDITVVPAGTGKVHFETSETRVGINNTNAKITTKGTGDLTLDTNSGTNSGFITIADGVNGNISITPNGTGRVVIDGIQHPIADGTNGQALTTNGSGQLSFTTISGGASTLNDLTDVTISSPGADQILKYDTLTNQWINGTAPTPSIALDGLSDVTTTTPSNGQALIYNSSTFQWENQTLSSGSGTVTSVSGTGTVSGLSLSGTVTTSGSLTLGGTLDLSSPPAIGATAAANGTFTTLTVNAANDLRLADSDSSNYVGFKAPTTVSANKIWTLPSTDGTNGQALTTNGSGTLSWATAGSSISTVVFEFSSPAVVSGSTYKLAVSELLDTNSIASVASTYNFTLPAGTYIIIWQPDSVYVSTVDGNQNTNYQFFSISGDASITGIGTYNPALNTAAQDSAVWNSDKAHFTLTQSSTFDFRYTLSGSNNTRYPSLLTLMKVA